LSRCSAGVWSTIEADSDCVHPNCIGREENCYLECNVPGAADGVCCNGARFCPGIGVCDGRRWWTLGISTCGDGVKEGNETCDDGNLDPFDDCLETCIRAVCGDGVVQMAGQRVDECDEGDNNGPPPARCSSGCTLN
jgi:cysteine-rich repeat protein